MNYPNDFLALNSCYLTLKTLSQILISYWKMATVIHPVADWFIGSTTQSIYYNTNM